MNVKVLYFFFIFIPRSHEFTCWNDISISRAFGYIYSKLPLKFLLVVDMLLWKWTIQMLPDNSWSWLPRIYISKKIKIFFHRTKPPGTVKFCLNKQRENALQFIIIDIWYFWEKVQFISISMGNIAKARFLKSLSSGN